MTRGDAVKLLFPANGWRQAVLDACNYASKGITARVVYFPEGGDWDADYHWCYPDEVRIFGIKYMINESYSKLVNVHSEDEIYVCIPHGYAFTDDKPYQLMLVVKPSEEVEGGYVIVNRTVKASKGIVNNV